MLTHAELGLIKINLGGKKLAGDVLNLCLAVNKKDVPGKRFC